MLHGDAERFAVQWELNEDHAGHFMLGKMCLWISGRQIGSFDEGVTLSDVLVCLTYVVGDSGNRRSEQFCTLSGEAVFAALYSALFNGDDAQRAVADREMWVRFNTSLNVDLFDHWMFYLIDCDTRSRLLIGQRENADAYFSYVREVELAVGEFDYVMRSFQDALIDVSSRCEPYRE